jgi:SRSO17 transposase
MRVDPKFKRLADNIQRKYGGNYPEITKKIAEDYVGIKVKGFSLFYDKDLFNGFL